MFIYRLLFSTQVIYFYETRYVYSSDACLDVKSCPQRCTSQFQSCQTPRFWLYLKMKIKNVLRQLYVSHISIIQTFILFCFFGPQLLSLKKYGQSSSNFAVLIVLNVFILNKQWILYVFLPHHREDLNYN